MLEKFCNREEAPQYKDFGAPASMQISRFSGESEFAFGGPVIYFGARSLIEKPAAFSELAAAISPSLSRIAVIVNQAVMLGWQ